MTSQERVGLPRMPLSAIGKLVDALNDEDGLKRDDAREALVALGPRAIPVLIEASSSSQGQVRWEATKALGAIKREAAAPALVRRLRDARADVRWLAAEGLILLERAAIDPLCEALIQDARSEWLREGVHRVLDGIEKLAEAEDPKSSKDLSDMLAPLRDALEGPAPAEMSAVAAYMIKGQLEQL